MVKLLEQLFSLVLKFIKLPAKWHTVIGILLATCLYIIDPSGKPYAHVPGGEVVFNTQPFGTCDITFVTPVFVQQYSVSRTPVSGRGKAAMPNADVKAINDERKVLTIDNGPTGSIKTPIAVQIVTGSPLSVEIESVKRDGTFIDLRTFCAENLKTDGGEYHRVRYLRKDLAAAVFHLNDSISNWVMTFMLMATIALFIEVVYLETMGNFTTKAFFTRYLLKPCGVTTLDNKAERRAVQDRHTAAWARRNVRFSYLQIIGPAVGFLFTITSLVAALHPRLRSATDLDAFMNGLHIAMQSTLLGLVMRIIAIEGSRVNDVILKRADLVLSSTHPTQPLPEDIELARID